MVNAGLHVDVSHHYQSRYLVQPVEYRRAVQDRIERRLYDPVIAMLAAWGSTTHGTLATGIVRPLPRLRLLHRL